MASQQSLRWLTAAAAALLLVLLTFFVAVDVDARAQAIELAFPTSTPSSSAPVPPQRRHHNHHHLRRPALGPRPVTGVRRDMKLKENAECASPPCPPPSLSPSHPTDLLARCRELWRDATLDHFSGWRPRRSADIDSGEGEEEPMADKNKKKHRRHHRQKTSQTFRQRYFVCDDQWAGPGSPIFFYFGNEADVTLYLNATGLMWQSAPEFGAALVFAEHR